MRCAEGPTTKKKKTAKEGTLLTKPHDLPTEVLGFWSSQASGVLIWSLLFAWAQSLAKAESVGTRFNGAFVIVRIEPENGYVGIWLKP